MEPPAAAGSTSAQVRVMGIRNYCNISLLVLILNKGILWEIYECASEVLSHFGEDVWCDFSAQWAQKVGGNSLCNIVSFFSSSSAGSCFMTR